MIKSMPLNEFLFEYTERNIDNKYRPVAVGRYGIRSRDSIYSKELAKDYSKNKLIFKNTLTIGMGSVQIDIGILSTDETYSVSPAYHTYRINNINPNYLRYCLECRNQDMFVRYVKKGSRQGKTIDLSRWLTYEIPVYLIEDQEKIVDKIDRVQGIIDASEKQLVKLDELVKSRFVEMFGEPLADDMRYPKVQLGSLADVGSSKRIFEKEYVNEGIPFYRTKEIVELSRGNRITTELFITKERYDEIKKEYGVPQAGDLLISAVGTIGVIWIVDGKNDFYFKDGNLLRIASSDRFAPIYLKYLLEALIGTYKLKMSSGTAYAALTISALKEMLVYKVPLEEQNRFAAFVAEVDKSKLAVKQSLEKLETLKKSLMQQYFG